MTRAIDELAAAKLATVGPVRSRERYDQWQLLSDSGSEEPYRVPGETAPGCIRLPATFFLRGWHLVLEPAEIAMLLAVMDMTARIEFRGRRPSDGTGVALPQSVRWSLYGISDEVYTHVHELVEFGILELHDTMPHRRAGKIRQRGSTPPTTDPTAHADDDPVKPEPYRFIVNDPGVFDRDANAVVSEYLSAFDVPYRLTDFAGLIGPADLVGHMTAARRSTKG